MGIGPEEAGRLSLRDYQGLVWNWADRHRPAEEAGEVEPPDLSAMMERHRRFAARGFGKAVH